MSRAMRVNPGGGLLAAVVGRSAWQVFGANEKLESLRWGLAQGLEVFQFSRGLVAMVVQVLAKLPICASWTEQCTRWSFLCKRTEPSLEVS